MRKKYRELFEKYNKAIEELNKAMEYRNFLEDYPEGYAIEDAVYISTSIGRINDAKVYSISYANKKSKRINKFTIQLMANLYINVTPIEGDELLVTICDISSKNKSYKLIDTENDSIRDAYPGDCIYIGNKE